MHIAPGYAGRCLSSLARLARLTLSLALLLAASAATASEGTMLVVRFLDFAASAEVGMRAAMEQAKVRDPAAAAFAERALADFDPEEATRRLAVLMEAHLDEDDIAAFRAFAQTPTGQKIARIFRVQKSETGLREAFNALPRADFLAADRFFATTAAKKALAAINSPEIRDLGRAYGEELGCAYVERSNPELLPKARAMGKCLEKKAP
jgi:hypothetical protein